MKDKQIIDEAPQGAEADMPLMLMGEFGTKFTFHSDRVTIGRADDCDIVLSYNKSASPTHVVFLRGDEGWMIMDAGSVNGTWLNGKKLEPLIPHALHDTDVIIVPENDGDVIYLYDGPDEPEPLRKAPDDTVILNEPSMLWSDKFVIFTSLPRRKQPVMKWSFLKYDLDGNLYSDIPSPEYMKEHKYKQCNFCGAFAQQDEDICPSCGQPLPSESLGYADPVVYTDGYKEAEAEINDIADRMFPDPGLGWCFRIWHMQQSILRERYHIIWKAPDEMNPDFRFE